MRKVVDKIMNVLEVHVCNVCFVAMCVIVIIQIILRTAGLPLAWTEEFSRYLFVAVIYLACSRGIQKGAHLSVDIVPTFISKRKNQFLAVFVNVMIGVFLIMMVVAGISLLNKMMLQPQFSPANHINLAFPYSFSVVGAIMMFIRIIEKMVDDINNIRHYDPDEEEEKIEVKEETA